MNHYVTGAAIKALREKQHLTQAELAGMLRVSDKAVSKWENGRGFPDVSLLEPLGKALHVSVAELLCGQAVTNGNRASNMLKSCFYICPVCGNVILARGNAVISCCGIQLPAMEEEEPDPEHPLRVEQVEDELYVTSDHPMSKDHYLTFAAYVTMDRCEIRTLYPEGNAQARFFYRGSGKIVACCRKHGLCAIRVR